jgi:hypothetical protein
MPTPDKRTGEQLLPDETDHLEPILAIDLPHGWNDQMVLVIQHPIAKPQRKLVLAPVGCILVRIEPVVRHAKHYTGFPYLDQLSQFLRQICLQHATTLTNLLSPLTLHVTE